MNNKARNILVGIFLTLFVSVLFVFQNVKPSIFILHSYDRVHARMRSLDRGFQRSLAINRGPIEVRRYYLDLNRLKNGRERKAQESEAKRALTVAKPDLVLAIDDEANDFLSRNFGPHYPFRIFYVSLNQDPARYAYNLSEKVAGISEKLPLDGIKEALPYLHSKTSLRIGAVGVANQTGRAELAQLEKFSWGPHKLTKTGLFQTADEWKTFVKSIDKEVDVLLVLSYIGLYSYHGETEITDQELISWLEKNSEALPIGIQGTFVDDGGTIAFATDESADGEKSMDQAIEWLSHANRSPPSHIIHQPHFELYLHEERMNKRRLSLPLIYQELARKSSEHQSQETF